MSSIMILATDRCLGERVRTGDRPVPGHGAALAPRAFAPQYQQQPLQSPSAPRTRFR